MSDNQLFSNRINSLTNSNNKNQSTFTHKNVLFLMWRIYDSELMSLNRTILILIRTFRFNHYNHHIQFQKYLCLSLPHKSRVPTFCTVCIISIFPVYLHTFHRTSFHFHRLSSSSFSPFVYRFLRYSSFHEFSLLFRLIPIYGFLYSLIPFFSVRFKVTQGGTKYAHKSNWIQIYRAKI